MPQAGYKELRSVMVGEGHVFPERRTCPHCHSSTCITKSGKWYRHRMPGMNLGYGMPTYAGPVCKLSGKKVT